MNNPAASIDFHTARALLEWQIEMGADEALGETPVNRYDLPDSAPAVAASGAAAATRAAAAQAADPANMPGVDPVIEAQVLADGAADLAALAEVQGQYDHCILKQGARNFVFADGNPAARVMIIGEAPGRDEDREGRPFVGRAGQMLDRMFAAIGLARTAHNPDEAIYITNVMPWRPPQNRDPESAEIAMMLPFLTRHVELANPDLIVLMGNTPCAAALGKRGILRLRGHWTEAFGRPALPMTHPAYLLRNPAAKREAWADLLEIRTKLEGGT
jgi:DNA polymerase